MTKSELIDEVAERTKLPKKRAEEVVNCIFSRLVESLAQEDRVEIRGFGSFSIKNYEPYRGRNPKTGEAVDVRAKKSIHFKVGKDLKDRVNDGRSDD